MNKSRRRKGRPINGVLLLDKPQGGSSNAALQEVKRLYGAAKAGHTGSLDPIATGMLPICFGEATKFSQYLLDSDKRYQAIAKLGEKTSTGDIEGEIIQKVDAFDLSDEQIDSVVQGFIGPIDQIPPMYSALKHQGQPLYKLARQGLEIERPARRVTIYSLQWRRLDAQHLELDVFCSKGTYIRTLVEDIGEQLACYAHVAALRRVQVGPFSGEMMTMAHLRQLTESGTLDALDALLLPQESTLSAYPRVLLDEKDAIAFARGQTVTLSTCHAAPCGLRQVWRSQSEQPAYLLGVGEQISEEKLVPRRLVSGNES